MLGVNRIVELVNGWVTTQATVGAILSRPGRTCATTGPLPIIIFHSAHPTGLHLRPAREPDGRASATSARRAATALDRAVRSAEPRLDRVAPRRRVRRGILEWPRRQRQRGAAASARARVPLQKPRRAGHLPSARVVRVAPVRM
jgi:hypothetical protein